MSKIKKAVFPVAGLGTRFLPATKVNPKEMLPIVDKPLIQYAVEEALSAGITELIFVTSAGKRAIEDHFDSNFELENQLEARGKHTLLAELRSIVPSTVSCIYIRQAKPLGLGHAILCASRVVGDEAFAVLLADDLVESCGETCMSRMTSLFERQQCSVVGAQEVSPKEVNKYGIIEFDEQSPGLRRMRTIIEKPPVGTVSSNLAAVGRYILTPRIFSLLEHIEYGIGKELQLTDAIAELLAYERVYIHKLLGTRYDCGSHLGYLQATIAFALKHPKLGQEFRQYLQSLEC